MTLLTAFKVLLHRYSGQEDICVGSPVSGRRHQETEGLIGFFVNTLALRTDLSGNPAFRELLLRVRETTLSGYDHQGVPFSKIVETVMQDRDMSRSPVFQVMFAMQQQEGNNQMELEGLSVLPEAAGSEQVKFELTLTVTDQGNGLVCYLSYNRSLYQEATMQRMLGHYKQLLSSIVRDPEARIGDLQILDEQEAHLLLNEFSGSEVNYPRNKTIVDLLEAQALRTPEGIALVCGTEQLSYKELSERSNQLGHYLRACGVAEDSLVCICMGRSIDMIVAMIGILKAGGAYVPIDPEYPQERISYLLNDTAADIVISETDLKEILPATYAGQVLQLDALSTELEQQAVSAPVTSLQPHHLAYIIYTSGSTGRPKGVMIEHRNVLNLLNSFQLLAPPEKEGAGLTLCPFIFDVSVWELFINLCFGNTLHVLGQEHALDPVFIAQYLIKQQITTAYLPPTILAAVADAFEASGNGIALKRLLVGVLPIRQAVLQRFCNWVPDLRIINGYGPTETTVCGTFFPFRNAYAPEQNTPIGKPVSNNKIYILDARKQLVPVGVAGEICIAGEGVGRGYWNNKALSSQQFIQDPFSADNNARLYCTGDKGKWLPDGNIVYLGRLDDQLKIRGYRIEPGEIESVVQQSGLADQCLVLTREAPGEDKVLIAFVAGEQNFNRKEMVRYLQSRLPAYMIPGLWVALQEFPLTPNGKIDKRALLAASGNDLLTGANTAPRNETEEVLVEIWKELLHLSAVGVYDNFFALGGHSLLGMQLIAALKKRFRLEIPLKMIFRFPCIADLAEYIQVMQPNTDQEPENIPYKIFEL